jgi:hypothetical protein
MFYCNHLINLTITFSVAQPFSLCVNFTVGCDLYFPLHRTVQHFAGTQRSIFSHAQDIAPNAVKDVFSPFLDKRFTGSGPFSATTFRGASKNLQHVSSMLNVSSG